MIVDSSPILPVADALIIAQQVDAVLFSIFSDVSRKTKVFAALQRLQCSGRADPRGGRDRVSRQPLWQPTTIPDAYYASLPASAADSSEPST